MFEYIVILLLGIILSFVTVFAGALLAIATWGNVPKIGNIIYMLLWLVNGFCVCYGGYGIVRHFLVK